VPSLALKEHPLRPKLKIRTEADYLQAHMTIIEGQSRTNHTTLHKFRQRIRAMLEKWTMSASANPPASKTF